MDKLEIKIERSYPKGKLSNFLYGIIYLYIFLGIFILSIFLANVIPKDIFQKLDGVLPYIAVLLGILLIIAIDRFFVATGGRDEILKIEVQDQEIRLILKKKKWLIPYSEIKEISHNMVQTRFSVTDSRYRLKIIRKGKSALVFCNPPEEWGKKIRFEETGLGSFYNICGSKGIKCS